MEGEKKVTKDIVVIICCLVGACVLWQYERQFPSKGLWRVLGLSFPILYLLTATVYFLDLIIQ